MKLKFTNKMKGANKFNNKAGIVSSISSSNNVNRQCLSADGFSLLPSALRPCLFCLALVLASGFVILGINTNNTFASTYSISMNVPSSINMGASAAGNGAKVTESDITVISTCPSGYTVNIVGPSDATLYKDGDSSNSESNNSTNYIEASTGTKNNPVSITGNNLNTWGYTLTHGNNINNDTFIGLTNSTTELTSASSATSSSGVVIPVYYGVSVDTNRTAGTYQMANSGAITYTLTTDISCTSYQVAFNSNGGTGTMDSQWIAEDTATALATNTFTAPSGLYFAGWNTAADGSGTTYTNQASVTSLAAAGQTITLYAQWTDCPANKICYDNNNSAVTGNVVGTMGNQSATSNTDTVLIASNYSLDNYGFAGWSQNPNADTSMNDDDNDGNYEYNYTIYGPNATLTTWNINAGGIKLYAVWVPLAKDSSNNDLTFQTNNLLATTLSSGLDGGTLASKPNGFVTALKDQRDNQVYAVAKLADGNYWMIENLRLDTAGTVGNNTTDPTKTNQSLAQGYGDVFAGLADPETANFTNSTTANSLYYSGTQSGTATINIGVDDSPTYRFPRYNNSNTNNRASAPASGNANIYSYGNYYTWAAAMANTSAYSSGVVDTSLCPTNWHLPYGGSGNGIKGGNTSGGFYYLGDKLGTTASSEASSKIWRSFPNSFIYSGYLYNSLAYTRDSYGFYWSATAYSSSIVYYLDLFDSNINPGTSRNIKSFGFPVRCALDS